ncbi:MAG TPA: hypothetical protein VGN57_07660 [Pirellulaceae bacterium]|jgi:hypothetical protein|nr:hypothetical protein [Pirellulaceae bacterium]
MSQQGMLTGGLLELTRTFVERCANDEFVEVMEDYYADDVYQIEGDGARRDGRQAIVDFKKDFQTRVAESTASKSAPSASPPTTAGATASRWPSTRSRPI